MSIATADDLVNRCFTAAAAKQLCITDIDEHPTTEAHVYTCVVLGVYSRKAVSWLINRKTDTTLVNSAINMAISRHAFTSWTIVYADHGPRSPRGRSPRIRVRTGSVGDRHDIAFIKSLRERMETKLCNTKSWITVAGLSTAMAEYIENLYNT